MKSDNKSDFLKTLILILQNVKYFLNLDNFFYFGLLYHCIQIYTVTSSREETMYD